MQVATSPTEPPSPSRAWVGRQPIFGRQLQLTAYELLYRDGPENRACFPDASVASRQTLIAAFLDIGIDALCGPHRAFLNVTRDVLLSEHVEALPKHRVVLEVLEGQRVDHRLERRVEALQRGGFRIALDDFRLDGATAPLVEHADIVKLDLRALTRAELVSHVRQLKQTGVEVLVEKVETQEEVELCQQLGFHYLQGYHLQRPEVRSAKRSPASRAGAMRLLALVQDPKTPAADLEVALSTDVSLTYRVLHFLNSSMFARAHRIDSIHHAVVMLGRERLAKWVSMMVLSGLDESPPPCLMTAVVRARMSELLGEEIAMEPPTSHFTAGLFSTVDTLLDLPMRDVLAQLPLAEELNRALLERAGVLGEVLSAVEAYERGEWADLSLRDLPADRFPEAYFSAVRWAEESLQGV